MLQEGKIIFTPAFPASKQRVIQHAVIWWGINVVIEFSKNIDQHFAGEYEFDYSLLGEEGLRDSITTASTQ